jgi:hypothetical protein
MISMGNSNAYANNRPSRTAARPILNRVQEPYVPAIKDALPKK